MRREFMLRRFSSFSILLLALAENSVSQSMACCEDIVTDNNSSRFSVWMARV